jgi:predicted P-loop ATPase
VARYRAGEQYHLGPEEVTYLAQVQEEHKAQHPWAELVADWLEKKGLFLEVTVTQVLVEALSKPQHQLTQSDKQAVSSVLQDLGWERRRRTSGGKLRWVYARPDVG